MRPLAIRAFHALPGERDAAGNGDNGAHARNRLTGMGRFLRGHACSQRTQFKTGERRSPLTEFKRGQPAHNKLSVGTVRIRREANTGLLRAWVKVAESAVWRKRAVLVWESVHGPMPRGRVVHHRDRDSLNDDITNLVSLTRKEHADEHREDLVAWRASQ